MSSALTVLLASLCGVIVSPCQSAPDAPRGLSSDVFLKRIETAEDTALSDKPREGDEAAVESTLGSGGVDETWAILQLYKWKKMHALVTQWWESEDRVNRILTLICVVKDLDDEVIPHFLETRKKAARRFSEKEALQRVEEVDLVLPYLHKLAASKRIRSFSRLH